MISVKQCAPLFDLSAIGTADSRGNERSNVGKGISPSELVGKENCNVENPCPSRYVLVGEILSQLEVDVENNEDLECGNAMQSNHKDNREDKIKLRAVFQSSIGSGRTI